MYIGNRVLRYNIRGNYTVKEVTYESISMTLSYIGAFNDDNILIGIPEYAKMLYKSYGIRKFEAIGDDFKCSIGFNPDTNTWYGFVNHIIQGFTIGTIVEDDDIAYIPTNREEYKTYLENWFGGKNGYAVVNETDMNMLITHYLLIPDGSSIKSVDVRPLDIRYGKGEWTAETLEDAKQMAIDYVNNLKTMYVIK